MIITETLYQNSRTTPLGQIKLIGLLNKDLSRTFESRRVFGSYALVYLLEGGGLYFDANRHKQRVVAGDLLLLFPDLAHSYGPQKGDTWSEMFVVFDGPVFNLWRDAGMLNSEQPIHRLTPIDTWLERFRSLATVGTETQTESGRAVDVCRFLTLLTEALAANWPATTGTPGLPWIERACSLLGANLNDALEPESVAATLGLSYETFRKRFQEAAGVAPAHYRTRKRIEAACSLLQHTQLSNKEISDSLGFSDPFHFARRFKLSLGVTPKEFRRHATSSAMRKTLRSPEKNERDEVPSPSPDEFQSA